MDIMKMKTLTGLTDAILHSPGFIARPVLEMAVVIDTGLLAETVQKVVLDCIVTLKKHSEIYRNVRINVIQWQDDTHFDCEACPMMALTMQSFYAQYISVQSEKRLEPLEEYLNKFQARSKIILLFTDGKYGINDRQQAKKLLLPFLGRKTIQITCGETASADIVEISRMAVL